MVEALLLWEPLLYVAIVAAQVGLKVARCPHLHSAQLATLGVVNSLHGNHILGHAHDVVILRIRAVIACKFAL